MPDLVPVQSSNVEAIGHDPAANELHVRYKSGGAVYIYRGVDAAKHAKLMAAESIGGHLHQHIKPHHYAEKRDA